MMRRIAIWMLLVLFVISSPGCASWRKKFVRKKKKEEKVEMVIYPRDYSKQQLPSDELYRQYYTYWKAWHNELLQYVAEGTNKKKILSCFEQTILNLNRMQKLLVEEKANALQKYVDELSKLQGDMKEKNIAMISTTRLRQDLTTALRNIHKNFAPSRTYDFLIWNTDES